MSLASVVLFARPCRWRMLARPLGVAVLIVAAPASPARAATTIQATCSTFGSALTTAGAGDTIVLTGLCTGANAAFVLPTIAGLTIEGASTGTNGFDGTGLASQPALASPGSGTDGITLKGLTFENYSSAGAVRISSPIGSGVVTRPYVFDKDTFINNSNTSTFVDGGGLSFTLAPNVSCPSLPTPDVTLSGSVFSGNSAVGSDSNNGTLDGGGGGASIDLECPGAGGVPATASIVGNTFSHNHVDTPAGRSRQGGGLWIGLGLHLAPAVRSEVSQSANTFDSNSVNGPTGDGNYSGGGENVVGANVTSVGDRFIANSLPGPQVANKDSQGAGLAVFGGGGCSTPGAANSQFTNLVVTGNTIAAPTGLGSGATVEGAGIYVGCNVTIGSGSHLTLINSTVTGNTVSGSGAVAGIDGETNDSLVLSNSIVFGDSGGDELGGFGSTPGTNVTATFSDVCAIGSATSPFAGAGNICTSPALVNAPAGDVHETAASPTVDVGSNALVPGSVTTDFFGQPRILAGKFGSPAIVDIGAAEFVPAPVNTGLPVISGTAAKGHTLTTTNGSWGGLTDRFGYQWQDCDTAGNACSNIGGATSSTYPLATGDVGHTIRVVVTATNAGGSTSATSGKTATVTAPPPPLRAPVLTRVGFRPSSFTAKHGTTLKFILSTSATVTVVITQTVRGHKVKGRCRLNAKHGKRCTLVLTRATRTLRGAAGTNSVKLNLSQLSPGGYTATISARNSAGASRRTTLTFTIKKPPKRRRR